MGLTVKNTTFLSTVNRHMSRISLATQRLTQLGSILSFQYITEIHLYASPFTSSLGSRRLICPAVTRVTAHANSRASAISVRVFVPLDQRSKDD